MFEAVRKQHWRFEKFRAMIEGTMNRTRCKVTAVGPAYLFEMAYPHRSDDQGELYWKLREIFSKSVTSARENLDLRISEPSICSGKMRVGI